MTVAHIWRAIQDKLSGRLVNGASVMLCSPGTQTAIPETLYSDVGLTQILPNPFVCDNGVVDVYLQAPRSVQIKTTYGASVDLADNIGVLPLAENILTTAAPFTILNGPGTGLVLTGVDATTAQFAAASSGTVSSNAAILGWFLAQAFQLSSATRDANGALTSATVTWPDGIVGTFTADTVSSVFPGMVDAWHVTRATAVPATTYTQPAVTRDASGNITDMPGVTIS